MLFKNPTNPVFELDKIPKRIISLVPSQTELLVSLGLENYIVGVTKFCVHPNNLRKNKTIVGGTKTIKIDKIAALNPDIILCNKEENSKEIVEACKKIAPVHVSDIFTFDDSLNLINKYGEIFACKAEANKITKQLIIKFNNLQIFLQDKRPIKVAYFIWKDPWMVAANNTFINTILELNNFNNIHKNKTRYPEINLKNVVSNKNPELIFLSSEPYPFNKKHINEIKKYFDKSKIILVDGEMFSWHGSRLLKAFDYFKILHTRKILI
ncbi:ABC transporter substrate-binding protein [Tenacibaculum aestuariivivum]|uniref:ABC transporter substrate-binding protein n=1 Tax=Tenacibaculum aestuariivivum TaxID=2006131 RepID=UPI003AB53F8F